MNMKKKLTAIISGVLCLALLMALPFGFSGLADPNGSLNPETCTGAQFDESVYDEVTFISTAKNGGFTWPTSGTVLLKESGTNWSLSNCTGITVPSGLVVDIYKYYKFAGDSDYTYELIAHIDTTDGQPYTIGSSSNGSNSSSNSSNSGTSSNSNRPSNSLNKDWGEVNKSFASGVKSDFYDDSYTDVPSDMWCYDAIMTLTDGGLLAGYGNGKFGPNDNLTRAQVSIIFARLLGAEEIYGNGDLNGYESFNDHATADRAFAAIWYAGRLSRVGGKTILTDYELSLVEGSGGLIANQVGQTASMWQAVYDNWRASLDGGKDPSTYISSVDDLPDATAIHQWIEEHWELMGKVLLIQESKDVIVKACEDAICRAYNLGMIAGVDGQGTFSPYAPLTRGQMATILWRAGWIEAGCLNYNI